ncbi:MAG: phosphatidate cytidylyltransferase [Saprospiraceae bacterium]|nr:phosphatidate cytidylyltransferase [Saprospiraceae bacterium]
MLGGIIGAQYFHGIPFVVLFGIISALSLWEYAGIVFPDSDVFHKLATAVIGLLPYVFLGLYHLNCPGSCLPAILYASMIATFMLFTSELYAQSEVPFRNVGMVLLGAIYVGLPFVLLNLIAYESGTYDYRTVLGLTLLTWTNDTAAYILGKRFGKTPLMPKISPKKTWEGSVGGAFFTFLSAWGLSELFSNLLLFDWLVLGVLVVVFGSYGDLVESMLKRSYNIKDSGKLLPGHGGVLDRFDAFIYMLPFAATYLLWIR